MATMEKNSQRRGTFLVVENDNPNVIANVSNNLSLPSSYSSPSSPTYIHCNSTSDFISPHSSPSSINKETVGHDKVNGTDDSNSELVKLPINYNRQSSSTVNDAKEVNKSLNLHLGLPLNPRKIKSLRLVCHVISYFLSLVEIYLFKGWDSIPLSIRQAVEYIVHFLLDFCEV